MKRLSAVLLGLLAAVLLAEIALRALSAVTEHDPVSELEKVAMAQPPPFSGNCRNAASQARLGQMIRLRDEPDLIYRLRPDMDTCFAGARVRTNSDGLRAPREYARPKPADVFRLLLLGDSQAFGWGVPYEQTFGVLIEQSLQAAAGDRKVEVINAGTPAYNTAQEAADLSTRGVRYEPDCILILYIPNDFDAPFFLLQPRDPLSVNRSFLLDALARRRPDMPTNDMAVVRGSPLHFLPHGTAIDRVPRAYRHMVGKQAYRDALRAIRDTAAGLGVPVVNFAGYEPELAAELIPYQESLGIVHPDFHFPWKPEWRLPRGDPHLNREGHVELAERMLAGLRERAVCLPLG